MTLIIELSPELEARFKKRALANGYQEVSAYAKKSSRRRYEQNANAGRNFLRRFGNTPNRSLN